MRGQGIVACLVGLSALGCGDGPMTPADELTGRVVFASSRLNTSAAFVNEVFVMNADGSNQTRLTYTLDTLSVASPTCPPASGRRCRSGRRRPTRRSGRTPAAGP